MDFRCETKRDGSDVHQTATLVHEGREFTSGGGGIVGDRAVGYPAMRDGKFMLELFDGTPIGTNGRTTATWRVRSGWSSHMCQTEFTINGRRFTGRGLGLGMLWRGKAKK